MIILSHRRWVPLLVVTIPFFLGRQIAPLGRTDRRGDGDIRRPLGGEERGGDTEDDASSRQRTFEHVMSANDMHRFTSCPMPDEDEWLLGDTTTYAGRYIPKHLHKVILTASGGFPDYVPNILNMMDDDQSRREAYGRDDWIGSIQEAHLSWKVRNPGYEIRYYDLHHCRLYLRRFYHPIFLRAFDCIEAFAGKVNLFRYLVVYREGGYYSDWKQLCLKDDLLDYLSNSVDVDQPRWDRPASGDTAWYSAWGNAGRMQNAFFGAMPRSPILAEVIRLSLRNIQGRADLEPGAEALKMTGVGVLHKAVMKVARGMDGVRFGTYHYGDDKVFRHRNETIIKHKCSRCGQDQSWEDGNDYMLKLKMGEYFCPDAPSLFSPSSGDNGTKTSVLHGRCFW